MTTFDRVKAAIENHKGRKLDLNNHKDLHNLKYALEREFQKRDNIINNVQNVLSGQQTYDQKQYKVILDSKRAK